MTTEAAERFVQQAKNAKKIIENMDTSAKKSAYRYSSLAGKIKYSIFRQSRDNDEIYTTEEMYRE